MRFFGQLLTLPDEAASAGLNQSRDQCHADQEQEQRDYVLHECNGHLFEQSVGNLNGLNESGERSRDYWMVLPARREKLSKHISSYVTETGGSAV